MTKLDGRQVAAVARQAGFKGAGLTRAVAVALAESGGNTQAVNVNSDKYRSRDRGLWQINSKWHPEVSDAAAFDPAQAAKAAYAISKGGTDWSAWSTWKNGTAAAQLPRATVAVSQAQQAGWVFPIPGIPIPVPTSPDDGLPPGVGPFGGLGNGALGLDSLTDVTSSVATSARVLVKAGAWMSDSHNWMRVGWVVGGTIGALIALGMIGKSGAAGNVGRSVAAAPRRAAKSAGSAATVAATGGAGAVAKGAAAVKGAAK